MHTNNSNYGCTRRPVGIGALAFCLVPLLLGACSSNTNTTQSEGATTAREAVVSGDCGFTITSKVHGVSKNGFNVQVKVTNVTGTTSTAFSVLVQADKAQLANVAHGSFQTTDYGYLLLADDSLADSKLDPGQTYTFELNFDGEYTSFTPIVMSSNGSNCDQEAPDVSLAESSNFFTSNGTLTLTATASDNVAVGKVVFLQDGTQIGVATAAPYAINVPVTNGLNGRHVYSAIAYDLAGNSASQTAGRVLVTINNKFFGTAVAYAADYTNFPAAFNQVTPGNAGKWGVVEAVQGTKNWTDLDTLYDFAKANNLRFKFHNLVWGSQQPAWIDGLSQDAQLTAINSWMAAVAAHYPTLEMIDVVNEPLHAPPSYAAALASIVANQSGTGWDWVIGAFQLARQYFPNSELILNEYSVLQDAATTANFITLVNLLKDRGLIDGIGEQGHFYERWPASEVLRTNLASLQGTGLPLYISELDVNDADDGCQANRLSELFSMFWSNPSVVGVTHWGYLKGNMWQQDAWLVNGTTPRMSFSSIQCILTGGACAPVTCSPTHVGDDSSIALEAELYDTAQGVRPAGNVVAYASDGSWVGFRGVTFNGNWNALNVTYAHDWKDAQGNPVALSATIDFGDNVPVATVSLPSTNSWSSLKTVSVPWVPTSGAKDVYVRFHGGGFNLDKITFTSPSGLGANVVQNSDFETAGSTPTADGWNSWVSGSTIAYTTARSYSGSTSLAMTGRSSNAPLVWNTNNTNPAIGWSLPAGNYQVSIYATVDKVPSASLVVQAKGADGAYLNAVNPTAVTNGTWTQLQGKFTLTKAGFTQVWVQEGWGPAVNADLYVDHVSIRPVLAANNLIPGSNFESGMDGWTATNATISVTNTWFHGTSGNSLMGIGAATGYPNLWRDISAVVQPGKKYQASAWVSGGTGGAWIQFSDTFGCSGTPSGGAFQPGGWVNGGAWTQITGILDLTACPAVSWAQLYVGAGTASTYYVDDVALTVLP